ncbi:MAG TPA: carbohydrate kinase [Burkholderiaceae bacterium]|jgi:fructokinase
MFVVAGEALLDVFTGAVTREGLTLDARVGGSPFNVAIGLARMGQAVAFLGGISNGVLGKRLSDALRAENVSLEAVHFSDVPTTISLVGVDAAGVPHYAFYGEGAADVSLPLEALDRFPAEAQALHVGSYTMVTGETAKTQRRLVEREHGRLLISYDPNLRLNVQPDIEAWRSALQWMLPRVDILKLSIEDFELLHPGVSASDFALHGLQEGLGLIVMTRGGEGATAWHAGGFVEAPAAPCAVVDTVGAGDTFQAALLARLKELDALSASGVRALAPDALKDVLGFATHAASITCSRRGADLPRREDLKTGRWAA